MLQVANSSSEIPVEESPLTISNVLGILYAKKLPLLEFTECEDLRKAVDKYNFLHVMDNVVLNCTELLENPRRDNTAMDILCFAAKLDNPTLAKAALACLSNDYCTQPLSWSLDSVEKLGIPYYLRIIKAWNSSLWGTSRVTLSYYEKPDWKTIATLF